MRVTRGPDELSIGGVPRVPPEPYQQSIRQSELLLILLRAVLLVAMMGGQYVARAGGVRFTSEVWGVWSVVLAWNTCLAYLWWKGQAESYRRHLAVAVDLVLISSWSAYHGPVPLVLGFPAETRVFLFYSLEIVAGAAWFGTRGAVATVVAANLLYLGIAVAPRRDPDLFQSAVVTFTPYSFVLALLAGLLVRAVEGWYGRLEQQAQALAQYRMEVETARRVAGYTRPSPLPEVPGFDLDARYRTARPALGGDLLGVRRLRNGIYELVVADVAGKTFLAIIHLPVVKRALEWAANPRDAGLCVTRTNRLLHPILGPSYFTALFFGLLDVRNSMLSYVNAGLVPPFCYRAAEKKVIRLEPTGPVVGAIAGAEFEQVRFPLEPGDLLLLCTDGVTGAVDARGDEFGEERVEHFLADHAGVTAKAVADGLFETILGFEQTRKRDDLTILVVKRRAEG